MNADPFELILSAIRAEVALRRLRAATERCDRLTAIAICRYSGQPLPEQVQPV